MRNVASNVALKDPESAVGGYHSHQRTLTEKGASLASSRDPHSVRRLLEGQHTPTLGLSAVSYDEAYLEQLLQGRTKSAISGISG